MEKRLAGVILICIIDGAYYALLSKRTLDTEEHRTQWVGGCQVTAAGKMEKADNGDFRQCALRELAEETGLCFLVNPLIEVVRDFSDEKEHVIFMSVISFFDAARVMQRVHVVPVTLKMTTAIKDMFDQRVNGSLSGELSEEYIPFTLKDGVRMFSDEKQAVIKALSQAEPTSVLL